MSDTVIVGLISGVITLVGVFVSYITATNKVEKTLEIQQAVFQEQVKEMKADIKEHNHYAKLFSESMPVVQEQIKVINHRIADLEQKGA